MWAAAISVCGYFTIVQVKYPSILNLFFKAKHGKILSYAAQGMLGPSSEPTLVHPDTHGQPRQDRLPRGHILLQERPQPGIRPEDTRGKQLTIPCSSSCVVNENDPPAQYFNITDYWVNVRFDEPVTNYREWRYFDFEHSNLTQVWTWATFRFYDSFNYAECPEHGHPGGQERPEGMPTESKIISYGVSLNGGFGT